MGFTLLFITHKILKVVKQAEKIYVLVNIYDSLFSPKWMMTCWFILAWVENLLPQTWHSKRRSKLCTTPCLFRLAPLSDPYGQKRQLNLNNGHVSLWCQILCLIKVCFEENHFSHKLQVNPERQPKNK